MTAEGVSPGVGKNGLNIFGYAAHLILGQVRLNAVTLSFDVPVAAFGERMDQESTKFLVNRGLSVKVRALEASNNV